MNPRDHSWGLAEQLLATVVDVLQISNWQRAGGKRSTFPKPVQRPGTRPEVTKYGGKAALSIDEMSEWLGWETGEGVTAHG